MRKSEVFSKVPLFSVKRIRFVNFEIYFMPVIVICMLNRLFEPIILLQIFPLQVNIKGVMSWTADAYGRVSLLISTPRPILSLVAACFL